jgi:2'-5' RNA ligase
MLTTDDQRERFDASVAAPHEARLPRIFVGLKLVPEIARELAQQAQGLERSDIRPVPPDDLHLTLVPPWNAGSIPEAIAKLRRAVDGFGAFPLTCHHLGYGPEPRRPQFLWAECAAGNELSQLHAALIRACGDTNERPFRAHVTLARLRDKGRAIARKHPIDRRLGLTQRVAAVQLFQSPPAGQRCYRVLASIGLAGEANPGVLPAAAAADETGGP